MDKSDKRNISLICFAVGVILILLQDLKGISTINVGFVWPFAEMFYAGLILIIIGYYLK